MTSEPPLLLDPPLLGEPPCEGVIGLVDSAEHAEITNMVARAQDCMLIERIGMIPVVKQRLREAVSSSK